MTGTQLWSLLSLLLRKRIWAVLYRYPLDWLDQRRKGESLLRIKVIVRRSRKLNQSCRGISGVDFTHRQRCGEFVLEVPPLIGYRLSQPHGRTTHGTVCALYRVRHPVCVRFHCRRCDGLPDPLIGFPSATVLSRSRSSADQGVRSACTRAPGF